MFDVFVLEQELCEHVGGSVTSERVPAVHQLPMQTSVHAKPM